MKEIKAYIRTSCLDQTVRTLKENGVPGLTIVTVHPIGYGFQARFSLKDVEASKQYYDITKLELVCDDEDADTFVNAILDCSHSGSYGDGLIFLSDVKEVVKIKTRKRARRISDVS